MRRLGQALGRDPMAIYRHAADKHALLDGVVEHVAAELIAPASPTATGTGAGTGTGIGKRSCGASRTRSGGWPWPTRTWCRCC